MIDISLRVMLFMWISSFMLLAGQYVMADALNMKLTNPNGDEIESQLLSFIDTEGFNTSTQNILRGECDASAQALPTHGYYTAGYTFGTTHPPHRYIIVGNPTITITQDSFQLLRPENPPRYGYQGQYVWLLEHGPEFDINTLTGTELRGLANVTVSGTFNTGGRTFTLHNPEIFPELEQNSRDRTGTYQFIGETHTLFFGTFLGNVVDDSCAARNPDGTLSTDRQFDRVQDFGVAAAYVGWELIQLLSGTYIFNLLALFGVPSIIVAGFVFMYIILLTRTIIGYIRGV